MQALSFVFKGQHYAFELSCFGAAHTATGVVSKADYCQDLLSVLAILIPQVEAERDAAAGPVAARVMAEAAAAGNKPPSQAAIDRSIADDSTYKHYNILLDQLRNIWDFLLRSVSPRLLMQEKQYSEAVRAPLYDRRSDNTPGYPGSY